MQQRSSSQPGRHNKRPFDRGTFFAATPNRWETSRSSAASLASSAATERSASSEPKRNLLKAFLNSIVALFSSSKTAAASLKSKAARGLESPYATPVHDLRTSRKGAYPGRDSPRWKEPGMIQFTMGEILKATKNFSPTLKIGQGGFGIVYKGTLDDGSLIAIKRAKKAIYNSHLNVEFQSEIKVLGQIEHFNLVRFFGYLEENEERVIVVEYVPNGTLRDHLDGIQGNYLDLGARLEIAVDVAHAVTYLHMYADYPIIHRDIKSSNILLTENLRAKVADFGFARLGVNEAGVTHISTQVKGTAGYLDPEYLRTFQLTDKSDVFSFGVLLVELVSGRRPIERKRELKERLTTKWAMKKFMQGKAIQILDPNLPHTSANNLALEKILELASQCLAPSRQTRPSMQNCAQILWNIRKDYRELLLSDSLPQFSHQRNPSINSDKS
ncbi:calmodulin-binding receptor-like cytoplasmic kinase 2 [Canna indica]|uniref:non-specific serine/threonine protein kinase n=1 Tax=Canna indica TaxID=4628 RepID=A0AAQ3QRS7_9LILI|nr:calmodulin-binding receptor-like cytoplasmic kinase 2 [Canna indica]